MRSRTGCRENAELLPEYSAGKLETSRAVELERHLLTCPSCRDLASAQGALWSALDDWKDVAPSAEFDRRLYERIDGEVAWWERALRPFRPALRRIAMPLAAAAGLALLAGVIRDRPAAPPPAPRGAAAQIEPLAPEQAEDTLEDMELLRGLNGLARPDASEPRI